MINKIIIGNLVVVLLLFTCLTCFSFMIISSRAEDKIIGVKIYEYKGDKEKLASTWKEIGVNTVFASTELLSDDEFKKYTRQYGIKTFVILPVFFSPEELAGDSTLYAKTQFGAKAKDDWVEFVCPSEELYKQKKIRFIKEFVQKHSPDGISLDFIRHFVFWEMVYPDRNFNSIPNTCFDEKCITAFCKSINAALPDNINDAAAVFGWIQKNHLTEWVGWKCGLITGMVERIVKEVKKVKPDILVNLHIVPWRHNDFEGAIKSIAGQDIKNLSVYADYISPMTYSHMVKQTPGWINSVVKDFHDYSEAAVLPSIQVGTAYLNYMFTASDFELCLDEALKEPSAGVVFWNWSALELEKEKLEIIMKKLK